MGKAFVSKLAKEGARDPEALAAWIGRKKHGASAFQKLSARGREDGSGRDPSSPSKPEPSASPAGVGNEKKNRSARLSHRVDQMQWVLKNHESAESMDRVTPSRMRDFRDLVQELKRAELDEAETQALARLQGLVTAAGKRRSSTRPLGSIWLR